MIKKQRKLKHKPYTKLKGVLAENGITQRELSKVLDLSPVTVNQKINGTLEFSYSEVEIICDLLSVSSEIFRGQKVA